jgi:phosphoglycolate phosphatase-like HAD superfamily hydrolase
VATGKYRLDELQQAGADYVVSNLTEPLPVLVALQPT